MADGYLTEMDLDEEQAALLDVEDEEEEQEAPTADYYWNEEDPEDLGAELQARIDNCQEFVRTSRYYNWARKSWAFYHGLAFDDCSGEVGVQVLGDDGEIVGAQINHMRNLVRHLYTAVTKDRPSFMCRARNSDLKSIRQADLGDGLIEYYLRHARAEKYTKKAVEHALVLAEGFVALTWDPTTGEVIDADPERLTTKHEGDLSFHCPTSFNIIRDLTVTEWEDHKWIGVRKPRNKWDLIAAFPEYKDAILNASEWSEIPVEDGGHPFDEDHILGETDQIVTYEFWHLRCPAVPMGRYVLMVGGPTMGDEGGGTVLHEDAMPYRDLPVHRVVASDLLLTPFGYSPAFDLIGIQELINMYVSAIASNVQAFGIQSLWAPGPVDTSQLFDGMNLIESDVEPKALNLVKNAPELFQFLSDLITHGEIVAGVDALTRGHPDEHIRSGAYAALLQAQTLQFSSALVQSYTHLLESLGTGMLRILRDFADTERVATIIGKHNQIYRKHFTGDDLDLIDRVTVDVTNPILNTTSGKLEIAQMLLAAKDASGNPLIKTPEEILHVFQTGQIDSLTQADTAMLSAIREENEMFLDGQEVPSAMAMDNHVLHIREHAAIFGTKETRSDPQLRASVEAHLMQHINLLLANPNTQMLQTTLGYNPILPPGAVPDGAGAPTAAPLGNQPQPEPAEPDEVIAPPPAEPELDGRSVAKIPEPSQPPQA